MYSPSHWQVPNHQINEFSPKQNDFCVCVFVINEGEKLLKQLDKMQSVCRGVADIVVADGGSQDGSTEHALLQSKSVNTLLVKTDTGKLGSQMRMAFAWALKRGYKGVVTVDGNGKDGIEAIPHFAEELKQGKDHVQGSRFIPGGYHANTPAARYWGVKLLHAPVMRLASGFHYTDTTNGFRAYSANLLSSGKLAIFRDCFTGYELHYYIAVEAAREGFICSEIPVSRVYPAQGKIPTKIHGLRGNFDVILKLFAASCQYYAPRSFAKYWSIFKKILLPILLIAGFYFMFQNYYRNSLKIHNQYYFLNAENGSESLVTPVRLTDYDKGLIPFWHKIYASPENRNTPYLSGGGTQGIVAGIFYKHFTSSKKSEIRRIETTRKFIVCLTIIPLFVLLAWLWFEFGLFTALAGYFILLYSGWLVAFARNFYWLPGSYLLPFCVCAVLFMTRSQLSKKASMFGAAALFLAFLLRFTCGFEFTSCVFFAAFIPLTFYGVKYAWSWGRYLAMIFSAGVLGLLAFGTALLLNIFQNMAILHTSFAQEVLRLKNNVATRTGMDFSLANSLENMEVFHSQTVSLKEVFHTYFYTGLPVVFDWHFITVLMIFTAGCALFFFLFLWRDRGTLTSANRKTAALFAAAAVALCSPLSWLILAKGHAQIHYFIVFFIFSLPAIPLMLTAAVYFAVKEFSYLLTDFRRNYRHFLFFGAGTAGLLLLWQLWVRSDTAGYKIYAPLVRRAPDFHCNGFYGKVMGDKLWILADKNQDFGDHFFLHLTPRWESSQIRNADFIWKKAEVKLPLFTPFRLVVRDCAPALFSGLRIGKFKQDPNGAIHPLWETTAQLPLPDLTASYITNGEWLNGVHRSQNTVILKHLSPELRAFLLGKTIALPNGKKVLVEEIIPNGYLSLAQYRNIRLPAVPLKVRFTDKNWTFGVLNTSPNVVLLTTADNPQWLRDFDALKGRHFQLPGGGLFKIGKITKFLPDFVHLHLDKAVPPQKQAWEITLE